MTWRGAVNSKKVEKINRDMGYDKAGYGGK